MPPAIEVRELRKRYGDVEALRGVSFRVERGEVVGLLGPNGAGKTTTVEILEGYRDRSSGELSVLGHDPRTAPVTLRRRIGIVLQSSGFYPRVTVEEAVRQFAGYYPAARDPAETVALVGDPELVFLDEPTTGFDPAARRAAWEVVRRLRELGKTILLTTHYLDEAQELSDRVAIVQDGRIVAEGPPRELGGSRYRVVFDLDGRRVEHDTDDPTELLHRLTSEALARGTRLENLHVSRPSLEEVYLELTREAE